MVVENRSGATGNIGAQAVARAEPDGHTLLLTLDSALAANPELYGERRMGFDVEKDLAPIMTQVSFSLMLAVHPSTGITNLKEFVAATNKGNGLNYSSAGIASPGHLTMEALHVQVGGTLGHIPYRGNAPATNALLAGEVAATFIATPGLLPHVRAGKLTALAVSGAKRSPLLPELSTIGEAGYSDATTEFTFVFLAPAGTPQPIIDELNTRMRKAMADPEITRRMQALAIEPIGSSPADASAYLQTARKRWGKLIKDSSIQPER
jgi:tripartite-type tricarboxylate transporter receptor subunit TctC